MPLEDQFQVPSSKFQVESAAAADRWAALTRYTRHVIPGRRVRFPKHMRPLFAVPGRKFGLVAWEAVGENAVVATSLTADRLLVEERISTLDAYGRAAIPGVLYAPWRIGDGHELHVLCLAAAVVIARPGWLEAAETRAALVELGLLVREEASRAG